MALLPKFSFFSELIPEEITFIAKDFIIEKQPNLWFGSGGSAKSYMAIYLALCLSSGSDFLGEKLNKKYKVLYVDFETKGGNFKKRGNKIIKNLSSWHNEDNLIYQSSGGHSLPKVIKEIKKITEEQNIEFIIIDSTAYACGGDANDQQVATNFFNAVNSLDISSLIIGHENKMKNHDMVFGSVFFTNSARVIFNVTKKKEIITFTKKKGNDLPEEVGDIIVKMTSEGEDIRFERLGKLSLSENIINNLSNNRPLTADELSEITGSSTSTVRVTLTRMKAENLVSNSSGKWKLVNKSVNSS